MRLNSATVCGGLRTVSSFGISLSGGGGARRSAGARLSPAAAAPASFGTFPTGAERARSLLPAPSSPLATKRLRTAQRGWRGSAVSLAHTHTHTYSFAPHNPHPLTPFGAGPLGRYDHDPPPRRSSRRNLLIKLFTRHFSLNMFPFRNLLET